MKLTKLHLFLIVLVVLVASTLGFSIKEYYENNKDRASKEKEKPDKALEKGDKYNPFKNKKKKRHNFMKDYDCTIADLEDRINPEREKRRKKYDLEEEEEEEYDFEYGSKRGDDYILKSQIVPPVCPKCPDVKTCPREKKCPPCPAPKRCPDVKFNCKPVYNTSGSSSKGGRLASGQGSGYDSIYGNGSNGGNNGDDGNNGYGGNGGYGGGRQQSNLPMPMLNSFAQFN